MSDKSKVIVNGNVCDSVDYEEGIATIERDTELPEPHFAVRDDAWSGKWKAGEVIPINVDFKNPL